MRRRMKRKIAPISKARNTTTPTTIPAIAAVLRLDFSAVVVVLGVETEELVVEAGAWVIEELSVAREATLVKNSDFSVPVGVIVTIELDAVLVDCPGIAVR